MPQLLQLRSANSGAPFMGNADLDTLLWDNTAKAWYVGSGGGGGAVSSVFGRTGAVVAATGDYDGDQVDNVSTVPGASISDALEYLLANAGAVDSVFGRTGAIVAVTGDYDSDQIDNLSNVAGASVSDALDALKAASGVSSFKTRTGAVSPAANDYTLAQIDVSAIANGATLVKRGGALIGLGSASAEVPAADTTRTPSTDKVCTLFCANLVNTSFALTLGNSTFATLGVTVYVGPSTGTGRWSVKSADGSTAFLQPDQGAWLVPLQWSAATNVWVAGAPTPA